VATNPIVEQMQSLQRSVGSAIPLRTNEEITAEATAENVYGARGPYEDMVIDVPRQPVQPVEGGSRVYNPDVSDLTIDEIRQRFPSLYAEPETAPVQVLPEAFEKLAKEETVLGMPVGKRASVSEVDMEPMLEVELLGTQFAPGERGEFALFGAGFVKDKVYKPFVDYDPREIDPNVSIRDILNFEDADVRNSFMSHTFFHDKKGRAYKITPGRYSTAEELADYADQVGAVSYTNKDGKKRDFPWTRFLGNQLKLPPDVSTDVVDPETGRVMSTSDIKTARQIELAIHANGVLSYNLAKAPIAKPLYARYLHEVLIERGVTDERTRAILIESQINAPTMGDLQKIVGNFSDNAIRPFVELGLLAFGETADVVDSVLESVFENDIFTGNDDLRPLKALGFPVDYERREELMRKVYEDFPSVLQRYYISIGADITLPQAQVLASRYTGLLPRGIQLFAEIRAGSGVINYGRKFTSKAEMKAFERWAENKLETDPKNYGPNTSFDKLLAGYKAETSRILRSEATIQRRIDDFYQVADSELPKEMQVLYSESKLALAKALDRKGTLLANIRKRGTPMTEQEKVRIDALNTNITIQQSRLNKMRLSRNVPQFVKESNIQDNYLVAGSATLGHYMPEIYNVDPELGEFAGILVGAIVSISEGKFKGYERFSSVFQGPKAAKLNYLVGHLMGGGNKSFNEGLLGRASMLAKYEDELLAMNITPDLASSSITTILDLAALKYFEQLTAEAVSMGKLLDSETNDILYRNLQKQKQLVGELREVLMNEESLDPKSNFFKLIQTSVDSFEENANNLEDLIKTIEGNAVDYFTKVARNRTGELAVLPKPDKTLDAAIKALSDRKLLDPDADPGAIAESAATIRRLIADNAAIGASKIAQTIIAADKLVESSEEIVAPAQAAAVARDEPLTVKRREEVTGDEIEMQIEPIDLTSPGQLLAYQLIGKHRLDQTIASRPFVALETATEKNAFLTPADGFVTGTPTVDISDIFAQLLSPDIGRGELLGLSKIQGKTLTAKDRTGLLSTVNELTNPFFEAAATNGKTTKAKAIQSMVKSIKEQDPNFRPTSNKVEDLQFDVARWISTNNNVSLMRMNMSQLLELDRSFTSMRFATNDPNVSRKFTEASQSVMQSFDNMEIDGRLIGEMTVEFEGSQRKVADILQIGKTRWSGFKNRWYDTNQQSKEVAKLMGWGKAKNVNISNRDPFGIEFPVQPEQWIDVNRLIQMDDKQLTEYFASFAETLGTSTQVRLPSGQMSTEFVFDVNSPETESFKQIMNSEIALHVYRNYGRAGFNQDEFMEGIRRMEKAFMIRNADGSQSSLLSFPDAVDNQLGFDSLADNVKQEALDSISLQIKDATSKYVAPAKREANIIRAGVKFMQGYAPGFKGVNDLGKELANLGRVGYRNLVDNVTAATFEDGKARHIKELKDKGEPVTEYTMEMHEFVVRDAFRQVYQRDMTMASFVQTQKTMRTANNEVAFQSAHDDSAMRSYLGTGDPEQAAFIREEIMDFDLKEGGKSHYDNAVTIQGFIAELGDDPLVKKISIKGIPRALSVESYISRFYAVNRGVVRLQYVGTEALLQQMRIGKHSFVHSLISDPDIGVLFMEMVRTGRPLDPQRDAQFRSLLIQFMGEENALYGTEPKVTTTQDGARINVYANPGYYSDDPAVVQDFGAEASRLPEAAQTVVGERRAAKGFPEMREADRDLRQQMQDAGLTGELSRFSVIDSIPADSP
jgi:hypothetical protein